MPFQDKWGHDPSVQSMRQVFSSMEEAQQKLLRHLHFSFFDPRLRDSREQALKLFERAWPLAVRQGIITNDKDAAPLYIHCLAKVFSSVGIEVSKDWLPGDEKIIRLLREKR